ncbi:RND family efflux transporter MFP subunit [Anseongella ginsenosidimutans]|uniref:RND family efflux transporter MFP subunit n=1 Tax=Anseongella ginsenosidimutans TaxID=496056 RepID=A0A4R3KNM3_9SPHI|nr:efflux RND transporter periplasmic adaptor subunit [Anseongella ginsenosidimutans]TCS86111.1 RND family efflux transporter MFP subunit [Anseongella ginsenosidimutans]
MKKALFILSAAAGFAFLVTACGTSGANPDKQAQLEQLREDKEILDEKIKALEAEILAENPELAQKKVYNVAIDTIGLQHFEHYIQVQGRVESEDNVAVSAESAGIIRSILVKEGQRVSKGQTLAQIDNQVLQSSVAELKTALSLANTTYERQKNLWDQNIGTEFQFLQAKNNKERLEQQLNTLNEQIEMTKIKSPINGTVDAVIAKVGESIGPGTPSFRVVNLSDLSVKAQITDSYSGMVKTGDEVIVSFPDINKELRSKVSFVSRVIDPESRTFDIEINIPTLDQYKPNMVAVLKIVDYTADEAIVIPVNVIQETEGEKYVYVTGEENGKLVARNKPVEVGKTYNALAEVVSGLEAGEKLITTGYQNLTEGALIDIK